MADRSNGSRMPAGYESGKPEPAGIKGAVRSAYRRFGNRFILPRSLLMLVISLAACLAIGFRLFYLQVLSYDKYESKVLGNVLSNTTVSANRGDIYDSEGRALATNYTVYRVFISPHDIETEEQKEKICSGLSEILGVEKEKIREEAEKTRYRDRTIKRNVEEDAANAVIAFVNENNLDTCVYVEAGSKRYYPYGTVASHVLGFVGTDGGLAGLELSYDDYLTGVPGKYVVARDAHGRAMDSKYSTYIEGQDGADLYSTINLNIQKVLEEELKQTYLDSQSLGGAVGIAMNVKTGAILGMGTYPNYNNNSPYELDEYSLKTLAELVESGELTEDTEEYKVKSTELLYTLWKNKATGWLYEPGSTFKVVTTSMAFEEKVDDPNETFVCTGAFLVPGYSVVHCHKLTGHGTGPYKYMLQQSCNPTLMQTALRIGREKFYKYFQAYGYTERTGIDLPGEEYPVYHAYSNFKEFELAIASFGQRFKVTPIRQINSIVTVANGGYLRTPYIVDKAVAEDGTVVYSHDSTPIRQVVSTEVCRTITDILEEGVATDGGAKNTYVAGYRIAAKTGTSQIMDVLDENGNDYLRVGSTVAYAPADDPQIAVLICVDSPGIANMYGAYVAAPYVADFMAQVLPYLGVERNYSENDLATLNVTLRNYVGLQTGNAMADLANRGLRYEVKGTGTEVTYQVPSGGSQINRSEGKVYLYTGDAEPDSYRDVPNVMGLSAQQANVRLSGYGFNVVIEGTSNFTAGTGAVVVSQSPEAGESVPYGSVVRVTMRHLGDTE